MDKQYIRNMDYSPDIPPRAPLAPCCEGTLAAVVTLLRQSLYQGEYHGAPAGVSAGEEFGEILLYLQQAQTHLAALSRGEISTPVPLRGYTGDMLNEMRKNLLHVLKKARRLTVGDFSCDAGNMGELSEAFEVMGKTLQAALAKLEQQKQDLTELSETLRREIEARAVVEKDLLREQARLQKLASTDPLTGISNRRQFFQVAVRELERVRRTNTGACLAMLDIDHFKNLNDSLGHSAGDKALRRITKIITSIIRPYDLVGRYGGDEFIFLFSEISRDDAFALLERMRDAVEKAKISAGKGNPNITVSIGLTQMGVGEAISSATLDQAIKRADEALYKAKNSARNHVYII